MKMNRSRTSSRLARRQTKNSEKTASINGPITCLNQNGQALDEIDMMFSSSPKFFPIYIPPNKKVNTHNLAEIPSLQSDEDSIATLENASQNSENNERSCIIPNKQYGKRRNANSLIEARSKFRQLLNPMQPKRKPIKNESAFDGYELKTRRVKFEPRKVKKETSNEQSNKISPNEFTVKLFEKVIDLSAYCKLNPNQSIPLYPLCRLWARNEYGIPDSLKTKRNPVPPPLVDAPDPDGPYSDNPVDVYHLPKPEQLPRDENGSLIILRIPKRVRECKTKRTCPDTSFVGSMEHLTVKELLELNMPGWKQARQEYLEALRENEKRYHHSFKILKSIFDKANNGEQNGADIAYYKYPPYESDHIESSINIESNLGSSSQSQLQTQQSTNSNTATTTTTTTTAPKESSQSSTLSSSNFQQTDNGESSISLNSS